MHFINKIIISLISFLPESIIQIFSKKYVAGIDNAQALNIVTFTSKFLGNNNEIRKETVVTTIRTSMFSFKRIQSEVKMIFKATVKVVVKI